MRTIRNLIIAVMLIIGTMALDTEPVYAQGLDCGEAYVQCTAMGGYVDGGLVCAQWGWNWEWCVVEDQYIGYACCWDEVCRYNPEPASVFQCLQG